jgi:hypothetical protein
MMILEGCAHFSALPLCFPYFHLASGVFGIVETDSGQPSFLAGILEDIVTGKRHFSVGYPEDMAGTDAIFVEMQRRAGTNLVFFLTFDIGDSYL